MKIFISWSKVQSKEFAVRTKEFLESIDCEIKAFVSEVDINGGEDVQEKIISKITECEKLIICFTKENKGSPWLLFESGYARGLGKTVIPLLFDNDSNWHSWIDNPMNIAREVNFNSQNFTTTFLKSFDIKETKKNVIQCEKYQQAIMCIKKKFMKVDIECEDIVEKLINSNTFVIENPYFKEKTAYFLSGFESHYLYKTIIDSFLYTGKYLWIYGRKNMKLFDGSYKDFFKFLKEKTYNGSVGIDFKCLFLDPNSAEVKQAHPQQNIFKSELINTIKRAKDEIGSNSLLKNCFRFYSNKRDEIIIRIDNCIIYSLPNFDVNGRPQLLTNTGFEVFSVESEKGKRCKEKFEKIWLNAKLMD